MGGTGRDGDPMSDTEVDGTPNDEVDVRDEEVTTPVDEVDAQVDAPVDAPDEQVTFFPTGEQQAANWLRSLLIVVPLILGLLVVAAIGARMLTAEIPDPSGDPATEVEPPNAFCWDGSDKPADGCPVPAGRPGLRWVFPSFQANDLACRNALPDYPKSTRPAMYECVVAVGDGSVTVIYSQLTQVNRGRTSFEKLYGVEAEEIEDAYGKRLLFSEGDDPGADGDYDLAVMYPALPFAVEVSADSEETRDQALDSVLKFRASDDVMDHP